MTMRLAKRTRRRGAIDKAVAFAAARGARLLAAPPLRTSFAPLGQERALSALRAIAGDPGAAGDLEVVARRKPWTDAHDAPPRSPSGAIVVVCEGCHFGGSYELCESLRAELDPLPARPLIVASDVIVSEAQIVRARRAGADAIAPVALALTRAGYALADVVRSASEHQLLVIPECADATHFEQARAAGLSAVIVSLRDRETFRPCPEAAAALIAQAGDLLTFLLFADT